MNAAQDYDIDPVCGMKVDKARTDKPSFDYHGEHYRFCNPKCKDKFAADPYFYLSGHNKKVQTKAPKDAKWTCPMDPEIITDHPDTCPICGMALEPMDGVSDEPNHELIDFKHRLRICAGASIIILILTMGPMIGLPIREWLGETLSLTIEFLLASVVVLWAARPFFERGWSSVKTRNYNMWTLIMLGVSAAYGYSTVAFLFPSLFPSALNINGRPPVYFEASVVIVTLVYVGQVMELTAREKTGDAIKSLLNLAPQTARRVTPDGEEYDAPLANIIVGDQLRVLPGHSVPVDGEVINGSSSIDESMITGEAYPVTKVEGDSVTAGTINQTGSFIMTARAVGENTMLSKIVAMVASAQRSRAPIQSLADRVAKWFVPTVVGVAVLTFILWLIFGPSPTFLYALVASVSVLIIACPCALGLATPMSIMTATGRGAQQGILISNARALEQMAKIDTLIVDKTGTLTEGAPKLTDIAALKGQKDDQILSLAASLEMSSEHPLAKAVLNEADARGIQAKAASEFDAITGKGVKGRIGTSELALGNAEFMDALGVDTKPLQASADKFLSEGKTLLYLAQSEKLIGLLAITDPIKTDAKSIITALQSHGVNVIMATGDNQGAAQKVAEHLGIEQFHARALPSDKKQLIENLQAQGHMVGMAGDGVNDAPALAQADIGIAMGTGSDIAIETADIMLVKGNLQGLLRARNLSTATIRNIKQNLFFAFIYNIIGVPIAAGIFYPWTGALLSPMLAAAAMSFSSVSVIANSLRLRNVNLDDA